MSIIIEKEKLYTVSEVAEMLKITPQTVRKYIKEKKLKAQRVGRPYLISGTGLKEFLNITG